MLTKKCFPQCVIIIQKLHKKLFKGHRKKGKRIMIKRERDRERERERVRERKEREIRVDSFIGRFTFRSKLFCSCSHDKYVFKVITCQ